MQDMFLSVNRWSVLLAITATMLCGHAEVGAAQDEYIYCKQGVHPNSRQSTYYYTALFIGHYRAIDLDRVKSDFSDVVQLRYGHSRTEIRRRAQFCFYGDTRAEGERDMRRKMLRDRDIGRRVVQTYWTP